MSGSEITQVNVKGKLIGIAGLKDVLAAVSSESMGKTDQEIGEILFNVLSLKNYFPQKAKDDYIRSLLREFKRFIGEPVEEEPSSGLQAIILGPGCHNCSKLENDVRDVMSELKLPGDIIHVTDIKEIGKYGVMDSPALVINGTVVCSGAVPEKARIKKWLMEAQSRK